MTRSRPGWQSSQSLVTYGSAGVFLALASGESELIARCVLYACSAIVAGAYALSRSRTLPPKG